MRPVPKVGDGIVVWWCVRKCQSSCVLCHLPAAKDGDGIKGIPNAPPDEERAAGTEGRRREEAERPRQMLAKSEEIRIDRPGGK